MSTTGDRRPYAEALRIAEDVCALLRPHVTWLEVAGSLRRQAPTVGDIEIVATAGPGYGVALDGLAASGVIAKARYGEKGLTRWGDKYRGFTFNGMRFEVFLCDDDNRGYIYWLRTGPDSAVNRANTYLVTRIKQTAPFHVKDGYVWAGERKLHVPDEAAWWSLLNIEPIPPQRRSVEAYQRAFGRGHVWGNPNRFLPPTPQQQTLFDVRTMLERQDAPAASEAAGVRQRPAPPPFAWCAPWLHSDGRIWLHVGYGHWELHAPDSEAVRHYRDLLTSSTHQQEVDRYRLAMWLEHRKTDARVERLCAMMEELVELVRQADAGDAA